MNLQVDVNIRNTIKLEGDKFTNHPADRGGPTKYGVTQTTYAKYFQGSVENCTFDQAYMIYLKEFWINPKLDQIDAIDSQLAYRLYDWGVTSSPRRSIAALQRALNVLNNQGKDWPDMVVDGIIGPATLSALRALVSKRGADGLRVIRGMVQSQQSMYYMEIAERNPSQEIFEYGWQLNRAIGA